MDPVGSVLLWGESVVDKDPGEADPWVGGGGIVQASRMASEDEDQEDDSDWGECPGLGQWPWVGGGVGAVGLSWCRGRRFSSTDGVPKSGCGGCPGSGFMFVRRARVLWMNL